MNPDDEPCGGRCGDPDCDLTVTGMPLAPSGTEARVCEDIASRQRAGIAKYGTTVEENPLSLRQWLQHAYEETLDKAVYLRRAIEEIDKQERQRSG